MPHGSNQVVGLIEIAADVPSLPARSIDAPASTAQRIRNVRLESPGNVETVRADLTQIKDDLRVELASVVARIAQTRSRK